MPVTALIFDLDGTLIDSRADIARSANHALARHGFPALPVETISRYVGDGARPLLSRAAGIALDDARLDALYADFIQYYTEHPAEGTTLCPGALACLDGRLGLALGICTNKPRITTLAVLAALGIDGAFRAIVAGGDLPRHKPDPEPVVHAARALGADPSDAVMVGDGAQDVLAGRAAGARTVGVRGGIQPEERLLAAKPDALIDSLEELPVLLATWR